MQAHVFQRNVVKDAATPCLNAACKEDPAKLSQYGVVNLDLLDFDPHTKTRLKSLRNFVQGSVTDLTKIFVPGRIEVKTLVTGPVTSAASATERGERVPSRSRDHEVGYENLTYEEWFPLTGLPKEAYDEWLEKDVKTRRDIVGIFTDPEQIQAVREASAE